MHICQQADVVPSFLILTPGDVVLPPDRALDTTAAAVARPSGEGSYGTVYLGQMNVKDRVKCVPVAVKCLKFLNGRDKKERMMRKQVRHHIQGR